MDLLVSDGKTLEMRGRKKRREEKGEYRGLNSFVCFICTVGDLRDDTIPDDTVQHIDTLCWQDEASGVLQGHCVRLKNLR